MGRSPLLPMHQDANCICFATNKRWEAFHGDNKDALYYLHGGKRGLANFGNTCFMNAGLQCLAHIEPIATYFLTNKYHEELNPDNPLGCSGKLGAAFADLLRTMWQPPSSSSSRAVEPKKMHSALVRFAPHLMENNEQQDVQEFLAYMLDGLSEDLNLVKERPAPYTMPEEEEEKIYADLEKEYGEEVVAATHWQKYLTRNKSLLVDICQGQLRSILTCTECGYTSKTFDPYLYLSVPISESMTTVAEALQSFLDEEQLDDDNRWRCLRCKKKVVAKKKMDIYKAPSVLILHLKRFSFDSETGVTKKVGHKLDVPLTVDISDYIVSEHKDSLTYDIIGVANHTGMHGKGHYTATCKHHIDNEYYRFDDGKCCQRIKNLDEVITSEAYVLFLLRRGRESDSLRRQTITLPDVWPHWVFLKDSKIVPLTERIVFRESDVGDDEKANLEQPITIRKSRSKFLRPFIRLRNRGTTVSPEVDKDANICIRHTMSCSIATARETPEMKRSKSECKATTSVDLGFPVDAASASETPSSGRSRSSTTATAVPSTTSNMARTSSTGGSIYIVREPSIRLISRATSGVIPPLHGDCGDISIEDHTPGSCTEAALFHLD